MSFAGTRAAGEDGELKVCTQTGLDNFYELRKRDIAHLEAPSCLCICDNAGARTKPSKETCRLEETKVRPSTIRRAKIMPVLVLVCIKNNIE